MYPYARVLVTFLTSEDGPTVVVYAVMLAASVVVLHRRYYRLGR